MASGKCIDYLPDELLFKIFSNFATEQLAMTIQHVNCRWKEVSQDNLLWKNRAYSPGETTTENEIMQHLRNMPKLKRFSPNRGLCKKEITAVCNVCKNIERLELWQSQKLSIPMLKQILNAFPNLTYFLVPLTRYLDSSKFCTIIGQFKKLITLVFSNHVAITVKVLSAIADECPSIQHIDLGFCTFDDEDIKYFLEKKRYNILSFSVRCYISTLTYIAVSECTNLEYLVFENYNEDLPDTYMHLFSKLSNMKSLSIVNHTERQTRNLEKMFANNAMPHLLILNIRWCNNFEAQTLSKILKNCPVLRVLTICDDNGLDGGFDTIGTCSKLEKLSLECPSISDESFKHLGSGCHELKHLDIENCNLITDKSFEYICAGCPQLEHVRISNSPELTDGLIENLLQCKKLTYITITENQGITGIHFDKIPIHLVHLKNLQIWRCENFNKENLEKLETKMPQLKIECDKSNDDVCEESNSDIDLEDISLFE